jgi:N-acyl-D-aspartate/D-glutamate deacylase
VVFDPETIADRPTYAKATEPSVGVRYLLVAGTVVLDAGRAVPGVAPGRALVSGR